MRSVIQEVDVKDAIDAQSLRDCHALRVYELCDLKIIFCSIGISKLANGLEEVALRYIELGMFGVEHFIDVRSS